MSDLISRSAMRNAVRSLGEDFINEYKILYLIEHMDDARPVERTAKVIEHDASVTDTDGYKYHRSEYLCGACKKKVLGGDEYCSHCGCRLDWNEDIPMEYFESGGR